MCYNDNMDSRAGTASMLKRHSHFLAKRTLCNYRVRFCCTLWRMPLAMGVGTTAKRQGHGAKDARQFSG